MVSYTLGFCFYKSMVVDDYHVALIRKARPDWQAGKLNGIGGKIKEGESAKDCMYREFLEETGLGGAMGSLLLDKGWEHFLTMRTRMKEAWTVECFRALTLVRYRLKVEGTDEPCLWVPVRQIQEISDLQIIENLKWLIPLALDSQRTYGIVDKPEMFEAAAFHKIGKMF